MNVYIYQSIYEKISKSKMVIVMKKQQIASIIIQNQLIIPKSDAKTTHLSRNIGLLALGCCIVFGMSNAYFKLKKNVSQESKPPQNETKKHDNGIKREVKHMPDIKPNNGDNSKNLKELPSGERWKLTISGIVQAGGFRPFITQRAREMGLCGFTWNVGGIVEVFCIADSKKVNEFIAILENEKPGIIRIDRIIPTKDEAESDWKAALDTEATLRKENSKMNDRPSITEGGFEPLKSDKIVEAPRLFPADTALCPNCTDELFDPTSKREGYWFNNCTQCGPRYTILLGFPYTRASTTMHDFELCKACKHEFYNDDTSRRYYSEATCCKQCKRPQLCYQDENGNVTYDENAFKSANKALRDGRLIALKGVGGYHLICRTDSKSAVALLKVLKNRVKPLAQMFKDIDELKKYVVDVSTHEEKLLEYPTNAIVLLKTKPEYIDVDGVSIGAFLPYTPLHKLLLNENPRIIATSLNRNDEPIVFTEDDVKDFIQASKEKFTEEYAKDFIQASKNEFTEEDAKDFIQASKETIRVLYHDRPIQRGIDDSVVQVVSYRDNETNVKNEETEKKHVVQVMRRARGYVPMTLEIDLGDKFALAMGGDLKSTFAFYKDGHIFASPYRGDLGEYKTNQQYASSITDFRKLFFDKINKDGSNMVVVPNIIVVDNDSNYHTSEYAKRLAKGFAELSKGLAEFTELAEWTYPEYPNVDIKHIYHHEAHIASVLAEHHDKLQGQKVLGIAFDERGYGKDGKDWGGEFFLWDDSKFKRIAHLDYVLLAGDSNSKVGVKNAKATAACFLAHHNIDYHSIYPDNIQQSDSDMRESTSVGRMFDAVAAITGVCSENRYEGECAIALQSEAEKYADYMGNKVSPLDLKFEVKQSDDENDTFVLEHHALFQKLSNFCKGDFNSGSVALGFHHALADSILDIAQKMHDKYGVSDVALSGGVFQNTLLLKRTFEILTSNGFNVYTNEQFPPNDSGLCIGQLYLAYFGK